MSQSDTTQNASWSDYFELTTGGLGPKYQYKDTAVVELSDDLPQPPSDYPVSFSHCHYLVDIYALAKWDTTNMTSTIGMFNHCHALVDISPLRYWNLSNVTDMRYMFNCCYELADVSAILIWDVSNVRRMIYIFNGCHALPGFARLEVYDQQTFKWFIEQYLLPPPLPEPLYYNQSGESSELPFEPAVDEEEEVYEPWDESTIGPHPFPETAVSLTATTLPGTIPEVKYVNIDPVDDLSVSVDNELLMTLTPEMARRFFKSDEDDDY